MTRPDLASLLPNGESCYSLVMGVAKRAREIAEQNEADGIKMEKKAVQLAVEEYEAGKYILHEVEDIGKTITF